MNELSPTDGASLPRFFRSWIVSHYGAELMDLIDRAGRFHDDLTDRYPNTPAHNRKLFIKVLTRYKIPDLLINTIHFGLWVYDHCPTTIKQLLKKTV